RWGAAHALLGSTASAVVSSPFLRIAPTLHLRRRCRRFWCEEPKEGTANGWTRRRLTSAAQRSPDVVDMEYADLNLKNFYGAAPNVSRFPFLVQTLFSLLCLPFHRNGTFRSSMAVRSRSDSTTCESTQFFFRCDESQTPVEIPVWKEVFRDPSLPLMVDIGSGMKSFSVRIMAWSLYMFYVHFLSSHFMFANAMVSFEPLLSTYPGPLMLVSILCPDPHFKKRHHKRRVVQASLVDSISKRLIIGGQQSYHFLQVFVQSDVLELALDMRNQFDARFDVFEHVDTIDNIFVCDTQGWVLHNPMGIRTEREIHAELEGARIYRRIYQKQKHYV
ncbi:hypothetical protein GW17_00023821, partial [Ensete ventricosum]